MSEAELAPGIGVVVPFTRKATRDIYIAIFKAVAGLSPAFRRDDKSVQRALYAPARSRAILNCTTSAVLDRLGWPTTILTVEVDNPKVAADLACRMFQDKKIETTVLDAVEVEIGIPEGFMYFVLPLDEPAILCWPKKPDLAMIAKLTPPEPWTD